VELLVAQLEIEAELGIHRVDLVGGEVPRIQIAVSNQVLLPLGLNLNLLMPGLFSQAILYSELLLMRG